MTISYLKEFLAKHDTPPATIQEAFDKIVDRFPDSNFQCGRAYLLDGSLAGWYAIFGQERAIKATLQRAIWYAAVQAAHASIKTSECLQKESV